eukprot:TRINITY_DN26059_c0_g1_i1.p1 TRINITY_DN26059_c0_g1~~TRINITY_DN26059_c0_g1_i1.p1  ORF type:complete len:658 (-),score=136.02 TRINITY_DN26059_c0_g1_i1:24-1811(-)
MLPKHSRPNVLLGVAAAVAAASVSSLAGGAEETKPLEIEGQLLLSPSRSRLLASPVLHRHSPSPEPRVVTSSARAPTASGTRQASGQLTQTVTELEDEVDVKDDEDEDDKAHLERIMKSVRNSSKAAAASDFTGESVSRSEGAAGLPGRSAGAEESFAIAVQPWTPRVEEAFAAHAVSGGAVRECSASPSAASRSRRPNTPVRVYTGGGYPGLRRRLDGQESISGAEFADLPDLGSRRRGRPGSAATNTTPLPPRRRLDNCQSEQPSSINLSICLDDSFSSDQGFLAASLGDTADWTRWLSPDKVQHHGNTGGRSRGVHTDVRIPPQASRTAAAGPTVVLDGAAVPGLGEDLSELYLGGQAMQSRSRPSSRGSTTTASSNSRHSQANEGLPGNQSGSKLPGVKRESSKQRGLRQLPRAASMPAPCPPALAGAGLPPPPEGSHEVPPFICTGIARDSSSMRANFQKPETVRASPSGASSMVDRKAAGQPGRPLSWPSGGGGNSSEAQLKKGGYFGLVGSAGSGSPTELGEAMATADARTAGALAISATGRRCKSAAAVRQVPFGKAPSAFSSIPASLKTRPMTGSTVRRNKIGGDS